MLSGTIRAASALSMVAILLSMPLVVHGQSDDLEAELRATLREADGADSLSESEFNLMTNAFADQIRRSDLSIDDIALSRIEATLSASAASQGGGFIPDSSGDITIPAVAIAVVALLALAGFIWQKMHHGGALGSGSAGIGVTGLHKEEKKRLPWVS